MNKAELQKQIALYFSKLPKETQEVFAKMEWLETLKTISEKYALSPEQIQTLGTETSLVLLGVIHTDEYEGVVRTKLGVSPEEVEEMLAEIDETILKNIRPELQDAFAKNVEEAEEAAKTVSPEVEESLDARFDKLPEEVKKAVIESGYHSNLYLIGTENKLSVPQMGALEEITTDVIVGNTHPGELEAKIKERISVSEETAKRLAGEIDEKILKLIHKKEEVVFQKPPTPGINPVSAQKLGGPVQSTEVKTDYSLGNITKGSSETKNVPVNPKYSIDPYRELPE